MYCLRTGTLVPNRCLVCTGSVLEHLSSFFKSVSITRVSGAFIPGEGVIDASSIPQCPGSQAQDGFIASLSGSRPELKGLYV